MRLEHTKVKAKEITSDCLIYLPKEKRFFWVDYVDHVDGMVIFYFEENLTENGLQVTELRFKPNQKVINIINDLELSLFPNV